MNDFEPIEWAMQQTNMTVPEVVALILTAKTAKPAKTVKQPNQLDRIVEFVDGEFDVRAADVVARGICPNTVTANNLLSVACKQGRIDRIGFGVYAARGSA
ncbi:type IV toxin-antitoxin system AbiEi family antitoxin domain-containing protein [Mycolicibacterium fortuitum]|uniref:type IV toxin-antitoxin system AbiEi family antitoxin domain-containing protein n=1 Tax=Mycolicibacterium fortuitum TaxID=1766 RepID=UPI0007E95E04|nr:type IV toxin-antitoxin system AbiEi family antitoxin domain-containing protein [Mycolicibacterium fortuitum]OBA97484.1 hypothetical protein A5668_02760 [Mycolicibacterium fortuitum]